MVAGSRKATVIPFFYSEATVLYLFLLLYLLVAPIFIQASDLLLQGQTIKDADGGQLVSAGNVFALGFFTPGNKTNRRYLGIWYHDIPDHTVVWVANRDAPILDRSGILTLRRDGTLVVSDNRSAMLWSSSVLAPSATSPTNAFARLLDTGDLVVSDAGYQQLPSASTSGNLLQLWQSFDHPGSTFLPGMRDGLDLRTGVNTVWTSWASADDPAPGTFYAGVDPRPLAQLVLWEKTSNRNGSLPQSAAGDVRRWRSGQWNGQTFTGVWNMKPLNLYGTKFSNAEDEKRMYFTYAVYNATYLRIVVRHDGIYAMYSWRTNESKGWSTVFEQPIEACEVYNACGSNGVCTEDEGDGRTKRCECWRGFRPKSQQEWDAGEYKKGGCVRNTLLGCQLNMNGTTGAGAGGGGQQPRPTATAASGAHGFWRMGGLKLPDGSDWVGGVDAGQCKEVCRGNCSCNAYAYVSGIGCMVWAGDLDDVRTFPSGGNDVYIKLPASELPVSTSRSKWKLYIVAVVSGIVVTVATVFLCFRQKMKRKTEEALFLIANKDNESEYGSIPDLPVFSFKAIAAATGNFDDSNALGKGGYGPVYRGMINDSQEVAVKRLSRDSGQGIEEFKNEVILIAKLQHKNLVRLLGCCIQGGEKILVYEYMANKSLDAFLFDPEKRASLSWATRFSIIQGIARGLLYLHHDSRLRVIHRDLKASNILLDEEMQPKISDFGMARIFGYDQHQANTKRVVGTYGYMSPEYAMDGLFSVKSDVYSFGVLLLEIVSGKKNQINLDESLRTTNSLLGWAWQLWDEDLPLEFIDPMIRTSCSKEEALRCIHIGLSCIQDRTADRPTMPSVILMLGNESPTYPPLKQPTFSTDRSTCTGPDSMGFSSAEVTISVITGR